MVDTISRLAEELTPNPAPNVSPISRKYTRLPGWQWITDNHPDALDAWEKQHLDLLVHLDSEAPNALAGDSLVHADIHELNMLVDNGTVSVIDCAWSRTGPPWVDAVLLTIRLIAEGHDPADAEQLVSSTWGMQHASARAEALTTFAATTYGQWRRFSIEFPSPHRETPTRGAQLWTRYRLPMS
ncbi:phosphotransferase [Promicromonospora sp. NPDC023805]|uniref:phosphotransferase n=1 Tax=Promicromonospora sp. NPDC023805 TaxID=3154696 RepID=UPI0033F6F16F